MLIHAWGWLLASGSSRTSRRLAPGAGGGSSGVATTADAIEA